MNDDSLQDRIGNLFVSHNNLGGEPLTKQISRSLITPQSLTGYREFFR